MGWSIGFDTNYQRDIGYGVPSECDFPGCTEKIDRGLSYVCGGEPYGGEVGCGLYFCSKHLHYKKNVQVCYRCYKNRNPYKPKPDLLEWLYFKMIDPTWAKWRKENKLTPEDLRMEEDWDKYGLVLIPTKCDCNSKIHDVNCKYFDFNYDCNS